MVAVPSTKMPPNKKNRSTALATRNAPRNTYAMGELKYARSSRLAMARVFVMRSSPSGREATEGLLEGDLAALELQQDHVVLDAGVEERAARVLLAARLQEEG